MNVSWPRRYYPAFLTTYILLASTLGAVVVATMQQEDMVGTTEASSTLPSITAVCALAPPP